VVRDMEIYKIIFSHCPLVKRAVVNTWQFAIIISHLKVREVS
jgi:hypothetical protein